MTERIKALEAAASSIHLPSRRGSERFLKRVLVGAAIGAVLFSGFVVGVNYAGMLSSASIDTQVLIESAKLPAVVGAALGGIVGGMTSDRS